MHYFLGLNNIPLYGYTTYCWFIHLLMDTWFFPTFGLLWINAAMKIGMQLSVGVPVFNSFAFLLIYFLKTNVITWPLRLAPPMSHGQHPLLSLLFGVLIPAWFLLTSVPWHKPVHVPATLSPPAFYQLTHSRPSGFHSLFFFKKSQESLCWFTWVQCSYNRVS